MRLARLLTALVLLVPAAGFAGDWPRFLGPNGTNTSNEKDVPTKWTTPKWKVELPGEGISSPVVSKGKIFLQSATKDTAKRLMLCVDAANGKILWNKEFQGGKGTIHKLNSLASGTPAADGERVYAIFWDGKNLHLSAWNYEGSLLWKKDLGGYKSQHGAGMSPIVVGDNVIVNDDQDGSAEVLAFNKITGEPAWKATRPAHRACYSTPFTTAAPDGPTQLIVGGTSGFTAYDPKSGKVAWDWPWSGNKLRTVGSQIEHNGALYIAAGDGGGDRSMTAVNIADKKVLWSKSSRTPYVPGLLGHGDLIYWVLDKEGTVVCVNAKTGELAWEERLEGGGVTASPILVNGNIYVITEKGVVFVMKAGGSYEAVAKNPVGELVYASPAVADGHLFIRGAKHLFCFGK